MTQQALSKRIARLEDQVGVLVERGQIGASLTERGERLLPAAHQLLEAADHALATALDQPVSSLRVDVWGPVDPPEAMLRSFAAEHPDSVVEISMRRNLPAALDALRRNELDAVLGNVVNLHTELADGLSSQLVAVTPLAGLVSHPGELETLDLITWDTLRHHGLALPDQASRPEFGRFVAELAKAIGAPLATQRQPRRPGRTRRHRLKHDHARAGRLAGTRRYRRPRRADATRAAVSMVRRMADRQPASAGAPPRPRPPGNRPNRPARSRALAARRRPSLTPRYDVLIREHDST